MKKKLILILVILAVALTIGLTCIGCSGNNDNTNDFHSNTSENGQIFVYQEIIAKTRQSAVCIYASNIKGARTAAGSGFIISTNGYVVTNQHVVKDFRYYEVVVTEADNRVYSYNASLLTSSDSPDIAVLKIISTKTFNPLKFGKSAELKYGDPCAMIGNPKGIGLMTARAMVASPSMTISGNSYVAIDAPVNPGNSGGALISANCEVVGVITSRYSSKGNVNEVVMDIGFAQKTENVMNFLLKQPELTTILNYWS